MKDTSLHGARLNNVGDPLHGDDALNLRSANARYGTLATSHAAVTLGVGSDAALSLSGQQLTLANVLTPGEHTSIGDGAPHHAAVTLDVNADTLLSLVAQALGLDTQSANYFFGGPTSGAAAVPTFRLLTTADLPTGVQLEDDVYNANAVDDTGTGTLYVGKENATAWLVQKIVESGIDLTVTYATVANNPTVADYATAWAARTTTLVYGTYGAAF